MARKQGRKIINIAVVAFLLFLSVFGGWSNSPAFAETSETDSPEYSDVLDDLKSDENFNPDEYPQKDDDNSLNVIQIAESTDKELLIYVYQPSGDYRSFKATSINIAKEKDNSLNLSFDNYPLTFLNSNGVFYKYKVENFELAAGAIRYYNISQIMRKYENMLDTPPSSGSISETPYPVRQLWTVLDLGEEIRYSMTYSEVIRIQNKYVGFCEYSDGVNLGFEITSSATLAHFVAFSTDKRIDTLKEAKVTFKEQNVTYKMCGAPTHLGHSYKDRFDYQYGDKVQHEPVTVIDHEKGGNTGGGNIVKSDKYLYNRIRSTSDFIKEESERGNGIKLTQGTEEQLKNTTWVLNFYETPIYAKNNDNWALLLTGWAALFAGDFDVSTTRVSDVMILELTFETDGNPYKLGAIDNKQTGDGNPANGQSAFDFWQWFADLLGIPVAAAKAIIIGIPCVLIFFVLFPILASIFPVFATVLKAILNGIFAAFKVFFKGLWFIICLPFKGIALFIQKIRERKEKA